MEAKRALRESLSVEPIETKGFKIIGNLLLLRSFIAFEHLGNVRADIRTATTMSVNLSRLNGSNIGI